MGDQVYPGIQMANVNHSVCAEDVRHYIQSTIGTDPVFYCKDGLRVEIFRHSTGQISYVRIMGIKLTSDAIRKKFASNKLSKRLVLLNDVDFGVERCEDGTISNHLVLKLCEKLSEGQGRMSPLEIFSPAFTAKFGNINELTERIYFGERLRISKSEILEMRKPGWLVSYTNTFNCKMTQQITGKAEKSYSTLELNYMTCFEALQAVCYLNKNEKFSEMKGCFVTKSDGFLCQLQNNKKLGNDSEFLNVAKLVNKPQYIPFSSLHSRLNSQKTLEKMCPECIVCGLEYTLLGVSSNLSWIAAICGCNIENSLFTWKNEDFYRKMMAKYHSQIEKYKDAPKLMLFIRGLMPCYDNVKDFKHTAFAAYVAEFNQNKFTLEKQAATGPIIKFSYIENAGTDDKPMFRYLVKVVVATSLLWTDEGILKMRKATLIPFKNGLEDTKKYKIAAVVHAIKKTITGKEAIVSMVVKVQSRQQINFQDYFKIIPHPPTTELDGIKAAIAKWENFQEKREKQFLTFIAEISSSSIYSTKTFGRESTCYNVWSLDLIILKQLDEMMVLNNLLDSCPVGLELTIPSNETKIVTSARVLNIVKLQNPKRLRMKVLCVLDQSLPESDITCSNNECHFTVWIMKSGIKQQRNGDELLDEPEDFENVFQIKKTTTFTNESTIYKVYRDDNFKFHPPTNVSQIVNDWLDKPHDDMTSLDVLLDPGFGNTKFCLCDPVISHFTAPHLEQQTSAQIEESDVDKLLVNVETTANFLMQPMNLADPQRDYLVQVLGLMLDSSQRAAVNKFLKHSLSIVQGPPGTGKTQTLVVAATQLFLFERGLIVICCQSNQACLNAYEKLLHLNNILKLGIRICRMLSMSMERRSHLQAETISDPHMMHNQVRVHPRWNDQSDIIAEMKQSEAYSKIEKPTAAEVEEFLLKKKESCAEAKGPSLSESELLCLIIMKVERDREVLASLTLAEKELLRNHVANITSDILAQTDIVICTVGTANDSRLARAVANCHKVRRIVSAIIVDEASLLTFPSSVPIMALNPKRLLLVGDDAQLPPTIVSDVAYHANLDISWMGLLRLSPFVIKHGLFSVLSIHYRMPESIGNVISEYLYNGNLDVSPATLQFNYSNETVVKLFSDILPFHMRICCYRGRSDKQGVDHISFWNETEVFITKKILLQLGNGGQDMSKVCIISMYDSQTVKIAAMVRDLGKNFNAVMVANVDAVQGREYEISLVNFVRSNSGNEVGFLRDSRRVNVALSRQTKFLFFIGDVKTLYMRRLFFHLNKEKATVYEYQQLAESVIPFTSVEKYLIHYKLIDGSLVMVK